MNAPTPRPGPSDGSTRRDPAAVEASSHPPPEDLSSEWTLRGARRVAFDGVERPALGRYVALARIASGGSGTVFLARHCDLGTDVALKVLHPTLVEGGRGALDRFLREARLAARLRSEHLVTVFDVAQDEASGAHYLVMEYVPGRSARAWADERVRAGAPPTEAEALDVVIAAAKGLVAAHAEGVVHRDVKPANILIPDGPDGRPRLAAAKLSDLGLARLEDGGHTITATGLGLGTPGYMAPEQAKGAADAGRPADVFGAGATLYALLAAGAPFVGATAYEVIAATVACRYRPLREVRPDVSAATDALVARCLAIEPENRLPDGSALLRVLEEVRATLGDPAAGARVAVRIAPPPPAAEPTPATPTPFVAAPTPQSLPPAPRRYARRTVVTLLACVAIAVTAAVLFAVRGRGRDDALLPDGPDDGAAEHVPLLLVAASAPFRVGAAAHGAPVASPLRLRNEDRVATLRATVKVTAEDDVYTIEPESVVSASVPADGRSELRLVSGTIVAWLTGDTGFGTQFQQVVLAVGGEARVRVKGDLEFDDAAARIPSRRLDVECLAGAVRLEPRAGAVAGAPPPLRRAMQVVGAGLGAGTSLTLEFGASRGGPATVLFAAGETNVTAVEIVIGRRTELSLEVPKGAHGEITIPGGDEPIRVVHATDSPRGAPIVVFSGPEGNRRELRRLEPGDAWPRP